MKRAFVITSVLMLFAFARPSLAEPTDAEKDAARILFTEGKELRDSGKILPSLDRFKRAYDLAPTPITTLELARTHAMLGHLVEARRLYRSIETIEKKPNESAKSLSARDEARQLATALDAKVPTVIVRAEGQKTASIDGKSIELGVAVAIDPGTHTVNVGTKSESFTIAEGEHDRAIVVDVPKEPPPKPSEKKPDLPPTPPESKTNTLVWIGGVVGGVGVLVGAGAGVLALSSASNVKDGCPDNVCPPSHHGDLDATHRWATVSTVGFGVAAVGATLLVIGLTSSPSKKDAVTAALVPYAAQSGGGLGFSGSF